MKYLFLALIAAATTLDLESQIFQAYYTISKEIKFPNQKGSGELSLTLNYTGRLYRKNNRYIYYEMPAYLDRTKDGLIAIPDPADLSADILYKVSTDSIQTVYYSDFDSLIQRIYGFNSENYYNKFEPGAFDWVIIPETKKINGLQCQKATFSANKKLIWTVWFCQDIPMQAGVFNIKDIPGLIVEAEFAQTKWHYLLTSFSNMPDLPDSVFWPREFNKPFIVTSNSKRNIDSKKNKKIRQLDILNNVE